jgi:hypothetical protein
MRSCLVLVLLTAPALAEPKTKTAEAMHTDDCANARKQGKTCVLTIENEHVQGGVPTANATGVAVIETGRQPSLIRLRREFIVEMIRSAEDL